MWEPIMIKMAIGKACNIFLYSLIRTIYMMIIKTKMQFDTRGILIQFKFILKEMYLYQVHFWLIHVLYAVQWRLVCNMLVFALCLLFSTNQ